MGTYYTEGPILSAENLGVKYGDKEIIKNINFQELDVLRPGRVQGQIIAFVGRSGRGKSTLFRCMAGLQQPNEGRVLIPDLKQEPVAGKGYPLKEVQEGDVGFVDQKYTLFRHKTIEQALHFAMRKEPLSDEEKEAKINQYLIDWGLEEVRNQYPNELSGGQRQRTAILEQVLHSALYIIMDEPFSGLDVGNVQSVQNAFQLISQTHELNTIIFSTHDIDMAVNLADSIYVIGYPTLEDGNLEPIGTIVKHYDLKAEGLAWKDQMSQDHYDLVEGIKAVMMGS